MCGISGIFDHSGGEVSRDALLGMTRALAHRGPDDEGLFLAKGVGLGHRRLSIIDLETGQQPLYNEDGSMAIVFNGEIYNFEPLRRQLEERGHRFRTRSDTETILHGYEEWGAGCLTRLKGMFAFAIWDGKERKLFLAVDPIGIKPLVYCDNGRQVAFASELHALLRSGIASDQMDLEALQLYFQLGYVPGPKTVYQGAFKLPPGHYLVAQNGSLQISRYWRIGEMRPERAMPWDEAKYVLEQALRDSVRAHLIADVPIGAFLSGGIDSSILVGLAAQESPQTFKTFSIGFADAPVLDEARYAQQVADYYGTDHHAVTLRYADILNAVPAALSNLGEPFADASLLPTYLVSREARKSVKVVFSGDGGDELFAGYAKYQGQIYQKYYFMIPEAPRRALVEPLVRALPPSRTSRRGELIRKAQRFVDGIAADPCERHWGWMRIISPDMLRQVLPTGIENGLGRNDIRHLFAAAGDLGFDEINAMLCADFHYELPFDMLTKVDLASMKHGLEVRVPYLDSDMVEIAFNFPGNFKLGGGRTKRILRETFARLLPPGLAGRRKQGFDLPLGEWLKHEMSEMFCDTVLDRGHVGGPVDREAIRGLYADHCKGHGDHTKVLWSAFAYCWWKQHRETGA